MFKSPKQTLNFLKITPPLVFFAATYVNMATVKAEWALDWGIGAER